MSEKVEDIQKEIDQLSSQEKSLISDGYHSFKELYDFRKMYNAITANLLHQLGICKVEKSEKHFDGEKCFGGGWFIISIYLPSGQISNHYALEDWDLFQVPVVEKASQEWDGHTSDDVLYRLKKFMEDTQNLTVLDVSYGKKLLQTESIQNPEFTIDNVLVNPLIHLTNQVHDFYNRKRTSGKLNEFAIFHYNKSMMELSNLNSSLKNLTRYEH